MVKQIVSSDGGTHRTLWSLPLRDMGRRGEVRSDNGRAALAPLSPSSSSSRMVGWLVTTRARAPPTGTETMPLGAVKLPSAVAGQAGAAAAATAAPS